MSGSPSTRPAVSVVMPFQGSLAAAGEALRALCLIERRAGDELILADNTRKLILSGIAPRWPEVSVVPASEQQSSYYARNVAVSHARGEWLLFIDSFGVPAPDLLDRYFDVEVAEDEGAILGAVTGGHRRASLTANLLVRAQAWRSIGGFAEGVLSGGDRDFVWRLQYGGWKLGCRPQARVRQRDPDGLTTFVAAPVRHGAGRAWLHRRHPDARPLSGESAGDHGTSWLIDALDRVGSWLGNTPPRPARPARSQAAVVVLADRFPELTETFITSELRALARLGMPARVEAAHRARRQDLAAVREHTIDYREDDATWRKAATLAWLLARHPRRCLDDLLARRRWSREEVVPPLRALAPVAWRLARSRERHLHAHFADGAALSAMRLARLSARTYSVTAHAYEIFKEPRNLPEKLNRAEFVTTGCRYNLDYLRRIAPGADLHVVVMGIDGMRLRRRTPYGGGRSLVAVGRLVEKKGLTYLIAAVAKLATSAPIERLEVVGDGPLREELRDQVRSLGLDSCVRLLGALPHDQTLAAIERSDLLVMPSVIAADGDRDSMPVAVKEALALEVPVVASEEVGLAELVAPAWGRLVAPGDPDALAEVIDEVLSLSPAERRAMGEAGRIHVLEHCSVERETERLARLIEAHSTSIRCSSEARTMARTSTRSSTG